MVTFRIVWCLEYQANQAGGNTPTSVTRMDTSWDLEVPVCSILFPFLPGLDACRCRTEGVEHGLCWPTWA